MAGEVVQIGKPLEVYWQPGRHLRRPLPRQSADEPAAGAAGAASVPDSRGDRRPVRRRARGGARCPRRSPAARSPSASGRRTSTRAPPTGAAPAAARGADRGGRALGRRDPADAGRRSAGEEMIARIGRDTALRAGDGARASSSTAAAIHCSIPRPARPSRPAARRTP